MPDVEIESLQVVVSVNAPELDIEKTVALNGFESVDTASEVIEAFLEWCAGIMREWNLRKSLDDSDARTAQDIKANVVERWQQRQKQLRELEQEKTQLQIRYDRNVQSMAEIRTRYLKEIESLREKIYRFQHHVSDTENRSNDWVAPKLCCLHPADCVTPADISLPLQEAVERIKARMEEDWNRSVTELKQDTEGLRSHLEVTNALLQRKDLQLAKQAKLLENIQISGEKNDASTNTDLVGDFRGADRSPRGSGSGRGSWPFRGKSRGAGISPRTSTEDSDSTNTARWRGIATQSSQQPAHDLDRVRVNTALKPSSSVTARVWRMLGRGHRRTASDVDTAATFAVSAVKTDSGQLALSTSTAKHEDPMPIVSNPRLISDDAQLGKLSVSSAPVAMNQSCTPESSVPAEARSPKNSAQDPHSIVASSPPGMPRLQLASLTAGLDCSRSPSKMTTPTIQKVHCRRESLMTPVANSLSGGTPRHSESINSAMLMHPKSTPINDAEQDQLPKLLGSRAPSYIRASVSSSIDGAELTPRTRDKKRRVTIPRLDLDPGIKCETDNCDSDSGDSSASKSKSVQRRNSGRRRAGTAPANVLSQLSKSASLASSEEEGSHPTSSIKERGRDTSVTPPAPVGAGLGASATSKLRGRAVLGSLTSCEDESDLVVPVGSCEDEGSGPLVRRTSRADTAPAMPVDSEKVPDILPGKSALELAKAVAARSGRRCTTVGECQKPLRQMEGGAQGTLTTYQMCFQGPTIIGEVHPNKPIIASATPVVPLSAAIRSRANRQSILVKPEDNEKVGPLAQLLKSVAASAECPNLNSVDSPSAAKTCAEEPTKGFHSKQEPDPQRPASMSPRQTAARQIAAPKCRLGRRATTFSSPSDFNKKGSSEQQQHGANRSFTVTNKGVNRG